MLSGQCGSVSQGPGRPATLPVPSRGPRIRKRHSTIEGGSTCEELHGGMWTGRHVLRGEQRSLDSRSPMVISGVRGSSVHSYCKICSAPAPANRHLRSSGARRCERTTLPLMAVNAGERSARRNRIDDPCHLVKRIYPDRLDAKALEDLAVVAVGLP